MSRGLRLAFVVEARSGFVDPVPPLLCLLAFSLFAADAALPFALSGGETGFARVGGIAALTPTLCAAVGDPLTAGFFSINPRMTSALLGGLSSILS